MNFMYTETNFILTDQHIKLLRRFNVSDWCADEFGAPAISPKRPYGNSSVLNDIHEILTGESVGTWGSKREELTENEELTYANLHREMQTALQVVLSAGSFEPGEYVRSDPYRRDWTQARRVT